ncbi:MAG: alkaline phosphatase, partial [Candidatus Electrothrix sp. AUS1_2]|nr:alkaline phosphatase [Candidatus Electrothrix sp. AUS1_2]
MRKKAYAFLLILLIISALALSGCTALRHPQEKTESESTKKVKKVILVIGDGMGPQQLGL